MNPGFNIGTPEAVAMVENFGGDFFGWIDRWRWTQPMQWYLWYHGILNQPPGCPRQHQDHPEPLNKQFFTVLQKSLPEKWVEITKFPSIEKTACFGLHADIFSLAFGGNTMKPAI